LQQPFTGEFGLPEDIYISRYKTSKFDMIEDFESSLDKVNVYKNKDNNSLVKLPVEAVAERLRNGTETPNQVLNLQLEKDVKTHVRIKLSKPDFYADVKNRKFNLGVSLARADSGEATSTQYNLLKDVKVEILAESTVIYTETLGSAGVISPLLLSDYSELESDDWHYPVTEPVLQTYSLPIQLKRLDEKTINKDLDLALDLIFEPNQDVHIILDDVGIFN
jgi:hypothetical protein